MKTIHVLRKPCSEGTVAANVLKFGTGALNIDGCRVGAGSDVPAVHATRRSDYPQSYVGNGAGWGRTRGGYAGDEVHWEPKGGRWPANLVLQHLPTCEQTGTREEAGYTVNRFTDGAKPFGGGAGHPYESEQVPPSTVPVWACAEGCPVAALDAQSGVNKSTVTRSGGGNVGSGKVSEKSWSNNDPGFGDTGGASRYFKQVGGKVTGEE